MVEASDFEPEKARPRKSGLSPADSGPGFQAANRCRALPPTHSDSV